MNAPRLSRLARPALLALAVAAPLAIAGHLNALLNAELDGRQEVNTSGNNAIVSSEMYPPTDSRWNSENATRSPTVMAVWTPVLTGEVRGPKKANPTAHAAKVAYAASSTACAKRPCQS